MSRSTSEVFFDHLRLRAESNLEEDLNRNYSDEVILIHQFGVKSGRSGIRESAQRLREQLRRGGKYEYVARHVESEYAFLIWRASSECARIEHGVDSFVIRDGRIVMQTVHYEVLSV
ncbi:nuclear transport factor 2 family protein [Steroidobacter sp. S1-65]|uniref:Nuclear transport factor 2 family protein n=1 Tax=Steroidobacter gossypii TaxID=2805490 RepID=A0ABS1WV89_9GAMM|nr:nuclear transport factor 2 family protein [Steroidobacter gossypii]MBM0104883.1 nuclear transport factor 2 family protein [Steroidobacter gossypii]